MQRTEKLDTTGPPITLLPKGLDLKNMGIYPPFGPEFGPDLARSIPKYLCTQLICIKASIHYKNIYILNHINIIMHGNGCNEPQFAGAWSCKHKFNGTSLSKI